MLFLQKFKQNTGYCSLDSDNKTVNYRYGSMHAMNYI